MSVYDGARIPGAREGPYPYGTAGTLNKLAPKAHKERDLSETTDSDSTASDGSESRGASSSKSSFLSIRRSLSWGKKRQKKKAEKNMPPPINRDEPFVTEHVVVTISRDLATSELGLAMHEVTGDIIVSHAGPSLEGKLDVGDVVLAVHAQELFEPHEVDEYDVDNLTIARALLREEAETVEIALEKRSMRTEVITRHAALRGTSLDKIGLTLEMHGPHVVVTKCEGLALKSGRVAVGDRILSINGTRTFDLFQAVELLSTPADENDVILEFAYGFCVPAGHEFDAESGTFMEREKPVGIVRRSLSFGKKRKAKGSQQQQQQQQAEAKVEALIPIEAEEDGKLPYEGIPDLNTEIRSISIVKNAEGKICATFKPHAVTGELIASLVADESPAAQAGLMVGDRIIACGSQANGLVYFEQGGDDDLDSLRMVLEDNAEEQRLEMLVQQRLRTEVIEFGHPPGGLGGPRTWLGISFWSFDEESFVRITDVKGPALRSGRIALGDRLVAVNGVRVKVATAAADIIKEIAMTDDVIELELALGYAAGEGVWYGDNKPTANVESSTGTPRKAKRSFSFGRKPRH